MAKTRPVKMRFPLHFVLFQYDDVPGEWHVACVENGAFGWGPTPQVAMDELRRTLLGQFEETLSGGHLAPFFARPDSELLETYNTWKHPAVDGVTVAARGTFDLSIAAGPGGRLRATTEDEIVLTSHLIGGDLKALSAAG